jgi:oligoribonuclease
VSKAAKIVWLDMEMTGLDVEKEVPIEVAAIVTDWQFKELDIYHSIIRQPQAYLDAMDEWNKRQHKLTGLVDLIPGGKEPAVVDEELSGLVRQHFGTERAVLAGNSIGQDRLFIRKYMPKIEATLHYRMLDVTAWKVVFNERFERRFKKKEGHRALDDIRESIEELKFYLSFVS